MSETNKMDKLILNGQNIDLSPDYQNIRNKPKINGVTVDGNKTLDDFGVATKQEVENVSEKVAKLPYGIYYGQYNDVESLPDVSQLTQKGYAYVATIEPNIFYIYTYDGEGDTWQDSGNKFDSGSLESNLSTKSKTKAPTTKAVKEGIEAIDVTTQQSFTNSQKETARTNLGAQEDITTMQDVQPVVAALNDRVAVVAPVTNEVKALGYKVLNPQQGFATQLTDTNTVYEIRDYFDLSGTEQEPATVVIPANCKLRFEGGMLGGEYVTLQGNNTIIESDSVCIQKGITIAGTWGNDVIYTKWLELVSAKDAYLPATYGTAGVMAPIFDDDTYYKSGRNYVLLEEEPDDWQTDWEDYYQIVDNTYVSVKAVAPPYAKNEYYTKDGDTYVLLTSDEAPQDWETNYADYYTNNSGTHVSGVAPEFTEDTYYKDEGEGYEKLLAIPSDWYTNWNTYYVKEDSSYVTPMGIIDNPNATNNIDVFKQLQNLINGTMGCKVEFEKGYYQVGVKAEPLGTKNIDGVVYDMWRPTGTQPENHVAMAIHDIPSVEINLNQSYIKALITDCPDWNVFRINKCGNITLNDGTIEGFAAQFSYPLYTLTYSNVATRNYEFPVLLKLFGKNVKVNGITVHNSEGDAIMIGSGGVACDSWTIENSELHHCGRNGVTVYSSNYATMTNTNIHHIGSNGDNGTVGTDNIMGRSPRAGIDIEFEDSFKLNPVMLLTNMQITDCGNSAISAEATSILKSFTAVNMYIHGTLNSSWLRSKDGKPTFRDSIFIHEGGRHNNIGGVVYDNCYFTLRKALFISNNIFKNCRIIDNAEAGSNVIIFYDYSEKNLIGKLINCDLQLKHSAYFYKKEVIGCTITFNEASKILKLYDSNVFKDTTFSSTVDATYNNSLVADSSSTITNTFEGCKFINLKGTNSGNVAFSVYTNVVFLECSGDIKLFNTGTKTIEFKGFHSNSLALQLTAMSVNSKLSIINSDIANLSKNGSIPTDIKDSRITFGNYSLFNGSSNTIDNSVISFSPAGSDYYPKATITNSVVTMSATMNNASEGRITLSNCFVDGVVTQAAFKGVATDCVFKNNADSGTDAQRPAYNLVVGQKYYDTTLGKPIYWNGTAWADGNGETVGLQVNDTSILIGAAQNSSKTIDVYSASAITTVSQVIDETSVQYTTGSTADTVESTSYYVGNAISLNEGDIIRIDGTAVILNSSKDAVIAFTSGNSYIASGTETIYLATTIADTTVVYVKGNWLEASVGTVSGSTYPVTLKALSANSTAPRGAKVIITNTDGEVVIINVVQSY